MCVVTGTGINAGKSEMSSVDVMVQCKSNSGTIFYVEDKHKMRISVYSRIERLGRNRSNMERGYCECFEFSNLDYMKHDADHVDLLSEYSILSCIFNFELFFNLHICTSFIIISRRNLY